MTASGSYIGKDFFHNHPVCKIGVSRSVRIKYILYAYYPVKLIILIYCKRYLNNNSNIYLFSFYSPANNLNYISAEKKRTFFCCFWLSDVNGFTYVSVDVMRISVM